MLTTREAAKFVGVAYNTFKQQHRLRGVACAKWCGRNVFNKSDPALQAWRAKVSNTVLLLP